MATLDHHTPLTPAFAVVEAMNGGAGLFGPGIPLDRVSPGMVIDVASLILQVNSLHLF